MNLPKNSRVVSVAFAVALTATLAAGNAAQAAEEMIGFGKETFQLNLGYYRANFSTAAAAGLPGAGAAGSVSGEDDLGLPSNLGVGRVSGHWRFAERHRLNFGYYNLDRASSGTLVRNIGPISIPSLGVNDTILAGSSVRAEGEWKVYVIGYQYSFYKSDNVEIGGGIGLNVANVGLKLSGTLITQNNGTLNGATAGSDVTAPLPVIGFTGDWGINERWRLKGNAMGFKANIGDVKATVTDVGIATEYRLLRNFGIGAGYSLLNVTGDVSKTDWNGSLSWKTGGWQLYGSLVF